MFSWSRETYLYFSCSYCQLTLTYNVRFVACDGSWDVTRFIEGKIQGGDTALVWAAANGHSDCVRLLVEAGANMNIIGHVRG